MYLALYRKYRPKKFSDVVGQQHVIKTLVNQINSDRVSHAYLFCGTRGTGKTSIAKIFAMAINCFDNKNGEPCFNCESCQNVLNKQDTNIIEIDAASNNGVDNIRDIREEVKYPPVNGKYKIYIIDEVHMLSSGAFNALLKTLEEPPEHIIFILATTDPQKIPATILSRCQRFDFKRIAQKDMFDAIKKYMTQEKINISDQAINYIIYLSDGALRDALSILDQAVSFYFDQDQEIDLDKIINITGSINYDLCYEFINFLVEKNINKILDMTNKIIMDGKEISQFVYNLILFLRDIIIFKNLGNANNKIYDLNLNLDNNRLKLLEACDIDLLLLIDLLDIFAHLQNNLKYAINPRILFELECIKFCIQEDKKNKFINHDSSSSQNNLSQKKNNDLNSNLDLDTKLVKKNNAENSKKDIKSDIDSQQNNKAYDVKNFDLRNLINAWPKIILNAKDLLKELLKNTHVGFEKNNIFYLIASDETSKEILKRKKDEIKNLIDLELKIKPDIDFVTKTEFESQNKNNNKIKDNSAIMEQLKKINMDITIED